MTDAFLRPVKEKINYIFHYILTVFTPGFTFYLHMVEMCLSVCVCPQDIL